MSSQLIYTTVNNTSRKIIIMAAVWSTDEEEDSDLEVDSDWDDGTEISIIFLEMSQTCCRLFQDKNILMTGD